MAGTVAPRYSVPLKSRWFCEGATGLFNYVRKHPVSCRLVLIKRIKQGRHKKGKLGQRMQIEESFRDLKSDRFGLGFSANRSTQRDRLGVLLLVGCLATFVLRLIGELGKSKQLDFQFQSNTRRTRPVLSVITLALQLVQHGMAAFPPRELGAALERLRYDHPALQL